MHRSTRSHLALTTASALLVAALSGCATRPAQTPEDSVRLGAKDYWTNLLSGKYDKAYELAAPSYRKVKSLNDYKSNFGGTVVWLRAEVVSVDCKQTAQCKATIEIAARPLVPPGFKGTITTQHEETWTLEDGRWWLLPKN